MPKQLIALDGSLGGYTLRKFDVGQGVEPTLARRDASWDWASPGAYPHLAVSRSHDILVVASGSANNWGYWTDSADLGTFTLVTSPSFVGAVYACAASSSHIAIGGANPLLYVFDRATMALITVNVAGLGTVQALDFSPDESLLAVYHDTSPHLRIYKVSDWSFVNASASMGPPASSAKGLCFTNDGQLVICAGNSTPYLAVANAITGVRTRAETAINSFSSRRCVPRPGLPSSVLVASAISTAGSPPAFEYNAATGVKRDFTGLTGLQGYALACDVDEMVLYVSHSTFESRFVSAFDIVSGELIGAPESYGVDDHLRQCVRANTQGMVIVRKGMHKLTGTVRDISNSPAARRIRAIRRSDCKIMAQTVSDPVSGDYELRLPDEGPYDVQFMTEDGESLNDLLFARAEPQPL